MERENQVGAAIEVICEKLSERQAVLFLGAGINADLKNAAQKEFPLGHDLARWIASDLLNESELELPLDEAAEMAIMKLGRKEFNAYLYKEFSLFKPGTAHLSLVQLPWDVIYTTNYDVLVEDASRVPSVVPAGQIQRVFSQHTDLATFTEEDILYYKLHGSIDLANNDGRIIITKEDYRFYETYRKSLFRRLKRDLIARTLVFVGYSLKDNNLREIIEDCRAELNLKGFPRSFSIRPGFSDVEEVFWRDKYNIQLIDASAQKFLDSLKTTWVEQDRRITSFDERRQRSYVQVDDTSRFRKIGDAFYSIKPEDCTGMSSPLNFFRGAEPSWADIRDKVAAERDVYWALYDAIFPELAQPEQKCSAYLVTGVAGTGKTTLVRSLVYDMTSSLDCQVLVHIPGTPLDAQLLIPLVDEQNPKRIVVVIHHAAEQVNYLVNFIEEANQRKIPVTIILEERKNQWLTVKSKRKNVLSPAEYELGRLSEREIVNILEKLSEHDALGVLSGRSQEEKVSHFQALAEKELLVALRELTEGTSFDKIVQDEYSKIPSHLGKRAYLYVSAMGQINQAIRFETLVHLLDMSYTELRDKVFVPTTGILLTCEETGKARHNAGFRIRARHPIIASIVFDSEAPDDDSKFEILNEIIEFLDPGYRDDELLLRQMTRNHALVETLGSEEKRRAFYDRLAVICPGNPHVYQHRSILERNMGYPDFALDYAKRALAMDTEHSALQNTYGMALEFAARSCEDNLRRQGYLKEARAIFRKGMLSSPTNPYSYIGEVLVLRQEASRESGSAEKALLQVQALAVLEEAYETTFRSNLISSQLAIQKDLLGSPQEAKVILELALKKKPTDTRLRDILICMQIREGDFPEAIKNAIEGAKLDPTSWRFQLHLARLKQSEAKESVDTIKGHYQSALRYKKGSIVLMIEYGSFLFMKGLLRDARSVFRDSKQIPMPSQEKREIRIWWNDENGSRRVFDGRVKQVQGPAAFVEAIPDNFEAFFWRTQRKLSDLREGDNVKFYVGFNAFGPVAWILRDEA